MHFFLGALRVNRTWVYGYLLKLPPKCIMNDAKNYDFPEKQEIGLSRALF